MIPTPRFLVAILKRLKTKRPVQKRSISDSWILAVNLWSWYRTELSSLENYHNLINTNCLVLSIEEEMVFHVK